MNNTNEFPREISIPFKTSEFIAMIETLPQGDTIIIRHEDGMDHKAKMCECFKEEGKHIEIRIIEEHIRM